MFNVTWRGTWTRSANKDAIGESRRKRSVSRYVVWSPQGSANEYRRENEGSETSCDDSWCTARCPRRADLVNTSHYTS